MSRGIYRNHREPLQLKDLQRKRHRRDVTAVGRVTSNFSRKWMVRRLINRSRGGCDGGGGRDWAGYCGWDGRRASWCGRRGWWGYGRLRITQRERRAQRTQKG